MNRQITQKNKVHHPTRGRRSDLEDTKATPKMPKRYTARLTHGRPGWRVPAGGDSGEDQLRAPCQRWQKVSKGSPERYWSRPDHQVVWDSPRPLCGLVVAQTIVWSPLPHQHDLLSRACTLAPPIIAPTTRDPSRVTRTGRYELEIPSLSMLHLRWACPDRCAAASKRRRRRAGATNQPRKDFRPPTRWLAPMTRTDDSDRGPQPADPRHRYRPCYRRRHATAA